MCVFWPPRCSVSTEATRHKPLQRNKYLSCSGSFARTLVLPREVLLITGGVLSFYMTYLNVTKCALQPLALHYRTDGAASQPQRERDGKATGASARRRLPPFVFEQNQNPADLGAPGTRGVRCFMKRLSGKDPPPPPPSLAETEGGSPRINKNL